ncbi:DivIVA domain-containing protein [Rhodohalobacter sp.]|uniref:DivIVA domain-containing protein n=1 Tax=Rhodohalobacter sp. TaxID=1974210 RepID=UPI002ACEF8F3|nr:DivIVA domain-containing protein [Rhodohalobacter sp.]MDZ7754889.1 DivIVA domain-containing protein [Rhodohalobacter sp.]
MGSKPMKLTALEIKQQQFEKSLRGYDTAEVHAYLNLIASEWEHMVGKMRELENQIDKMDDKLKHYERVEEALHETLQTAKDSAEQKLTGAKKESRNIIEKAEMEADSIVREAHQQRQQIRQSILRLLDRREEIISGIKSYLDIASDSLSQFSKDEASLFRLPKEPELEEMEARKKSSNEKKKFEFDESDEGDSASKVPQSLDDILDELD